MDLKYSWSTLLLVISVVLMENYVAAQNTTDDLVCPEEWTRRNDTCYQPYYQFLNYQEARDWCQLLGGDLPIPASRIEAEYIMYIFLSEFLIGPFNDNFVWIGCTDEAVEGVYRCVDDSLMPFTEWDVDQPDNRDGEDGVALRVPPLVIHGLNLTSYVWLVCEKKDPICPAGWTKHGTKCYSMISNTTKVNYNEGRNICQLTGGDLPVLDSTEEANFLIFFTMSHFVTVSDPPFEAYIWIGCTDQENEGVWTCVDNSTITIVDWDDRQPQNRYNEGAVGLKLERGLIHDTFFTSEISVVCEHALIRDVDECVNDTLNDCHANATCLNTNGSFTCTCKDGFVDISSSMGRNCMDVAAQNTADDLVCPEGWTRRRDACYQPSYEISNYQEARDWCRLFGGDLPIPASRIEAEDIIYIALSEFLFGLYYDEHFVWIGCTDEADEGVYRCVDDSLMPYTGWDVDQPENRDGEDGVALRVQPPVIHDLNLTSYVWLVCEKKDPICPAGWTRHGTKCYSMISNTTRVTYNEGRIICQLIGGDLPVLDSREEAKFLMFFTMSHFVTVPDPQYKEYIWIGCTDQENEGIWICVDNSTMTFADWDRGQPQNRLNEDAIGLKLGRGLIQDTFLTYEISFVCEHALIRDVDECANDTLNNCHAKATCKNTHGSFTCTCKDGFVDFSFYQGRKCVARARTCTLPQAPRSSHFKNPQTLYEQGQNVTVTCDDSSSSTSWQCGANGHWIEHNIPCPTDTPFPDSGNNYGVFSPGYLGVIPFSFVIIFGGWRYYRRKRNTRPMRRVLRSTTTVTRVTVRCDTGHQPGEGITNPGYFPPGQRGPLSEIPQPSDVTTPTEPPPPYEEVA